MATKTFAEAVAILQGACALIRPNHNDDQDALVDYHGWDEGLDDEAPTEPAYQIDDLLFCAADNAQVEVVDIRGMSGLRLLDDHNKRYDILPVTPAM